MTPAFRWLEATALSTWTRESTSIFAFPTILSAHAIGMALAAGISVTIALRALGAASAIPAVQLRRFVPVLWFGFWLNAASGVLLLVAYPTKALTNPMFYVKLACIAAAVVASMRLTRRLEGLPTPGNAGRGAGQRAMAAVALTMWIGAIFAGRLLAYTHTRVLADF